jgi:hypothetical protein
MDGLARRTLSRVVGFDARGQVVATRRTFGGLGANCGQHEAGTDLAGRTLVEAGGDGQVQEVFFAENFVFQEFQNSRRKNLVCWREGRAEVEFLTEVGGAAIPIEVKSGWVTQAKSLRVFEEKYHPPFTVVFSARNAGSDSLRNKHHYPLYLAGKFPLATCRT